MKKILVSRFSALGDVTIAVHVLKAVVEQNKDIEIIILTRPFFSQLFKNIERITCFDIDLKKKHNGIKGIKLLAKEITTLYEINIFVDIHNVLRTKLLKLFLPARIKKATINKGRFEKKILTRKRKKRLHQLAHSAERYAQTFIKAGIYVDLNKYKAHFEHKKSNNLTKFLENFPGEKIAIAPFAAHETKMYPLQKMEQIIDALQKKYILFILGGGKKEKEIAEKWEFHFKNVYSIINKFSLSDEIALIDSCSKIIAMDSGNMHLASLTKTQIISIWGATHPFLGFSPFKKNDTIFIQKNIDCRPCSVFGNKKCYKDKMYCLDIKPEKILNLII